MNIPQKFTFFNGNSLLKLTNIQGTYYCTLPHIEADTLSSAVYDRMNVEHKLHTGKWKIVEDLSVKPDDLAGVGGAYIPTMKFPFEFKYKYDDEDTLYTAVGMTIGGEVVVNWEEGTNNLEYSDVENHIKDGTYIVQSVGEQESKEEIVEPVPEYRLDIDEKGNVAGRGIIMEKHTVGNLSKLTLSVTSEDIDEAAAKMQKLADATENAAVAFESLQSVMDSMGISFGGNVNVQTFCCNDQ